MSRAVIASFLFIASPTLAQPNDPAAIETAELVKTKTAEILTVEDRKKCPEVTSDDGIVVCAEIDNGEDQLIFSDQRLPEKSGSQSQADSVACIPGTGCRVPFTGGVTIGFGKRRPPAIPYADFLKDLVDVPPDGEEVVPVEQIENADEGVIEGETAPE
jgi:hypothetical protein